MSGVPRLQRRGFATPDVVREFPHGRLDIVNLDETTIGRIIGKPGWRWSSDVAPIVRTMVSTFSTYSAEPSTAPPKTRPWPSMCLVAE